MVHVVVMCIHCDFVKDCMIDNKTHGGLRKVIKYPPFLYKYGDYRLCEQDCVLPRDNTECWGPCV